MIKMLNMFIEPFSWAFWSFSFALLALTFGCYVGVLQNGFVDFDDNIYVTANPITMAGLSWAGFCYAWTTFDSGNWIPLTWLSYQLDVSLFGMRASAFHATNLAVHCVNTLLLFTWLTRATRSLWPSFAVAALFGVHPLHVESVAWIAERKDVLSGFWLLVALLVYERYARRPTVVSYLMTLLAFALGLLSKSMLVTLPLLLLLIDLWPLKRWPISIGDDDTVALHFVCSARWLVIEKVPFLLLSLLDGVATIFAQWSTGRVDATAITSLARLPMSLRIGNALQSYGWYLWKTVWPTKLCIFYPHPLNNLHWGLVGVATALLVAISVYVGMNGRRRPYLIFGWLWFLVSLAPTIGLLQVGSQAYADRYSYIPQLGLLLLIVCEIQLLWSRLKLNQSASVVLLSAVLGIMGYLTAEQVAVWRTNDSLWGQALVVDSDNWFAHMQIGNGRVVNGQTDDETLAHLQAALRHRPDHPIVLNNLGWIYQSREDWNSAESYYRQSLKGDNRQRNAMHNLLAVLKKQKRVADGFGLLNTYVEQRPDDVIMQNELGLIYARRGELDAARTHFEKTTAFDSEYRPARYNLALTLIQLGRDKEARPHLEFVLSKNPNDANAHLNLGILLEKEGQLQSAREHFAAAVQNSPGDQEARDRLQQIEKHLNLKSDIK